MCFVLGCRLCIIGDEHEGFRQRNLVLHTPYSHNCTSSPLLNYCSLNDYLTCSSCCFLVFPLISTFLPPSLSACCLFLSTILSFPEHSSHLSIYYAVSVSITYFTVTDTCYKIGNTVASVVKSEHI